MALLLRNHQYLAAGVEIGAMPVGIASAVAKMVDAARLSTWAERGCAGECRR